MTTLGDFSGMRAHSGSATVQMQRSLASDPNGLAELKAQSRSDPAAAIDGVARQFEAYFLQQILSQVRTTPLAEDVLGGGDNTFTEMLHGQFAETISAGDGIGIAQMLREEFIRNPAILPTSSDDRSQS